MTPNNPYIHVDAIKAAMNTNKPSIPRFTPTFFGGMAMLHTGIFVRHSDHMQEMAKLEQALDKSEKRTEVVKDQLERMTVSKDSYSKDLKTYIKDYDALENINDKLVILLYICGIGGIALGATITFLGMLIHYN